MSDIPLAELVIALLFKHRVITIEEYHDIMQDIVDIEKQQESKTMRELVDDLCGEIDNSRIGINYYHKPRKER